MVGFTHDGLLLSMTIRLSSIPMVPEWLSCSASDIPENNSEFLHGSHQPSTLVYGTRFTGMILSAILSRNHHPFLDNQRGL
jgi:hypothetical protein